jgi:hypothetical protein
VAGILSEVRWAELEENLETVIRFQAKLDQQRLRKIPWVLNPLAWQARVARNQAKRRADDVTALAVAALRLSRSKREAAS